MVGVVKSRLSRALGGMMALAMLTGGLVAIEAAPADAAWSAPQFVRSISGNGRPGVFPWGVQYNPVSNEIIVGDYLNNQIRRYSPDGEILGSFYRSNNKGQPYSIGVDPTNGDIYVPEIADGQPNNRVARYTKNGTYVSELTLSGIDYQAWITVDGNGQMIQADSHYGNNSSSNPPAVRVWRLSDGKQVRSFNVLPPGTTSSTVPRLYGIDNDAVGNIWITDTFNNRILKYSSTGTFLASYGAGWFSGDARGMAVDDANNRLYVSDATVGEVEVFDLQGNHLETLGTGLGVGPTQLSAPRQVAVATDGTLYVAEYGNARIHRYSPTGQDLGFFPDPAQAAPAGQLGQPRDVDVDDTTGDVFVADSWNQRFQRFSKTGAFLGTWGRRGAQADYGMNYPRGIGVNPDAASPSRVWVVNQRGHHIKRYNYDSGFVDQLGDGKVDSSSAGYFRWPLDVEFWDGHNQAVVTDRNSNRVKILNATTGAEISQFTSSRNHGGAIDQATGNIYVSDSGSRKINIYNPTGTSLLGSFGSTGTADGQFQSIWDMVIFNGVVYVTDDTLSRIQAFSLNGTFLGKWGGFGSGAYQFKNPSGIAVDDDGLLYVADAGNDRIMVFDTAKVKGGAAWPPPTVDVTYPGNSAVVPGAPVRFAGTAADETGVASVEVSVKDLDSGLFFNSSNSTWSATQTWSIAPYTGASTKSVAYAWTFIGVEYEGNYEATIRSTDVAGNRSPSATRQFSVMAKNSNDQGPPDTFVTNPLEGQTVATGGDVSFAGTAIDDLSVASVDVAINKGATNLWWQPGGGWGPFVWLPATLDEPGTTATAWTYPWSAPANGAYAVSVRSTDGVGKVDPDRPLVAFSVGDPPPPDVAAPDGLVTVPALNASYVLGPLAMAGTATDNVGVSAVTLNIKDTVNNVWWQPGGGWGPSAGALPATLANPGGTATAWSYSWTPPVAGSYAVQLRTDDAAGNTDATRPWITFTVASVLDTVKPTLAVTVPAPPATVPAGNVLFSGSAADDIAVAKVEVAVRDTVTGLYLKPNNTWGSGFNWLTTTLASPGASSTTWERLWPGATPGVYGFQARVTDGGGNITTRPYATFTVT